MKDKIDLENLLKLAKGATPGPWEYDCGNGQVESRAHSHYRHVTAERISITDKVSDCCYMDDTIDPEKWSDRVIRPDEDCEFIAAANPQVITALVTRLMFLEEENKKLEKHISQMSCCCAGCTKHNLSLEEK